ncbi:hypothetical protein IVB56_22780 [Bradyrhizobium sp. CW7]|uniref:hypothetical protein n=1 Tax=Bradyrhizobium sp. CW7 TaxID=2782688 RepID=UPI001FF9F183|nr:hypothetical protein [Bradyrhizobium sp. CW7]MCK1353826.1 hypothetical protein [Bradyrhizobium sp. CW7]
MDKAHRYKNILAIARYGAVGSAVIIAHTSKGAAQCLAFSATRGANMTNTVFRCVHDADEQ